MTQLFQRCLFILTVLTLTTSLNFASAQEGRDPNSPPKDATTETLPSESAPPVEVAPDQMDETLPDGPAQDFAAQPATEPEPLSIHQECTPPAEGCVEYTFSGNPGRSVYVIQQPEMMVTPADVHTAQYQGTTAQPDVVNVQLKEGEPANRLASVTERFIGKTLAITSGHQVLDTFQVTHKIGDGYFQLNSTGVTEAAAWLKPIADTNPLQKRNYRYSIIALALVVVGLGIFGIRYVFRTRHQL